jgi:hypothetical protein
MKAMRLLVLCASFCIAAAHAADKTCTKADSAKAQKVIDAVVTWQQLYKAWSDYQHCDTGEVADLYTDALLRLAVDWKDAGVFAAAAQKDPQYKAFVFEHLKSPAAKDDRATIRSRAKTMCPAGQDTFCGELAEAMATAK